MRSENKSDLLSMRCEKRSESLESLTDHDRIFFKQFGERVQFFRSSKGIAARDISSQCGIPASDMHSLENGTYIPCLHELAAIAAALEIPAADLVDLTAELPGQDEI